ncbi:Cytochrome c, mono-and diheme variants [Pseudomonas delhiensis]|uniref:Cytochrome c, mono- and diheme variants n=1 Tax=Pseudomonas delhiensis TaxID=366289 RepID=A0A239HSL5_9PSED|nr:cytochrome c [Pseudomonas delhiensis]SDI46400.1 Cytochrome c, mono-and diheme variants [Pseudomonas delhiensis]SNS84201.1 Cytochrome c, mono- and diheme variants [Pseudomonas delhiensis]
MKFAIRLLLPLLATLALADLARAEDTAAVDRGRYLARLGDCAACHTSDPARPFAGGLRMNTPIGAIYSTNITPDPLSGIGGYSLADFARALREGRAADGHWLYPAMPYPSFAKLSDADVADLYQYFQQGVQPQQQANRKADIPWPLNLRWPLGLWSALFAGGERYRDDPQRSAQWNRGAYLVQGLGHCGSCHSPRGWAFQELAQDQGDARYLGGGTLDGWHAPELRSATASGLQQWSEAELVAFLKTGHNERTAAFGAMVGAVQNSTQYFTDEDLRAVAGYLKSLGEGSGAPDLARDDGLSYRALAAGQPASTGAALYLDNCAACHRSDGRGYRNTFPQLLGNSAVLGNDPSSLISIILKGSRMAVTEGAPTGLRMPDFGWRLDDVQVAELANFLRQAWGQRAPRVSAAQVAALRGR